MSDAYRAQMVARNLAAMKKAADDAPDPRPMHVEVKRCFLCQRTEMQAGPFEPDTLVVLCDECRTKWSNNNESSL